MIYIFCEKNLKLNDAALIFQMSDNLTLFLLSSGYYRVSKNLLLVYNKKFFYENFCESNFNLLHSYQNIMFHSLIFSLAKTILNLKKYHLVFNKLCFRNYILKSLKSIIHKKYKKIHMFKNEKKITFW